MDWTMLLLNPLVIIFLFILGVGALVVVSDYFSSQHHIKMRELELEGKKWDKGLDLFAKPIIQTPSPYTKETSDDRNKDPDPR